MELVGYEALKAIPYRLSRREHRYECVGQRTLTLMYVIHFNAPIIDGFGIAYPV
jgi:hypothetical protein